MTHVRRSPGAIAPQLLRKIIMGDRASLGRTYFAGVGDGRRAKRAIVTIGQPVREMPNACDGTARKEAEKLKASESLRTPSQSRPRAASLLLLHDLSRRGSKIRE